MDNLEELISMRALQEMQTRLQDTLDPRSWTLETRDGELEAVKKTALEIVKESVPVTVQLLTCEVDGQPFLYWSLLAQVLGSLTNYLEQARKDLDWVSEEERRGIAVDSEWLTTQIRSTIEQYNDAQQRVDKVLAEVRAESGVDAEEL